MSVTAEEQVETFESRLRMTDLERHRFEQFEDMRFTQAESAKLATTRSPTEPGGYSADVHLVRRMLEQGATPKQILRIFL